MGDEPKKDYQLIWTGPPSKFVPRDPRLVCYATERGLMLIRILTNLWTLLDRLTEMKQEKKLFRFR